MAASTSEEIDKKTNTSAARDAFHNRKRKIKRHLMEAEKIGCVVYRKGTAELTGRVAYDNHIYLRFSG